MKRARYSGDVTPETADHVTSDSVIEREALRTQATMAKVSKKIQACRICMPLNNWVAEN
jgi:hypothetical protein